MPPKSRKGGRSRKKVFAKNVATLTENCDIPVKQEDTTSVKREVESPVKKEHTKLYPCKFCNKSFKSIHYRKLHSRQCEKRIIVVDLSKKAVLGCKECNKKFRFKKSHMQHLLNEHSKVPGAVCCDQCHVRCPDKHTLRKHITDIHEREIFECPHCKKEFVRQAHVLRHMAQKGCDGKGTSVYPCEICHAQFSRKDNLMVHLRLQHILQKDFQCKQCQYSTRTFSKLIIHTQKQHSDKPQEFECDHCGKTTSSRAAMTKHLEIHGAKKFACDVCGYNTFTIEVMRRHVLTHVADKPYRCSTCDASFIQRAQLQRHLERHDAFECRVCRRTFASRARLVMHVKEHVENKKLMCPFKNCPKSLEQMRDVCELERHIDEAHGGKKPAQILCVVCNKSFGSDVNLRRHVASHTLERPRRCMYCVAARAYVRGLQLVRHVRKAHAAVYFEHLAHVRAVLGHPAAMKRTTKSEMDSILNVLDAEAERILEGYGEGVLYGGMQEQDAEPAPATAPAARVKSDNNPLMSEEELAENLNMLLSQLIDRATLECFGWPGESVDMVLEKVIEHCGGRAADRAKWTRVQCLRENAKHLFAHATEDKTVARMLHTHTIDQIIRHVLAQVTDTDAEVE